MKSEILKSFEKRWHHNRIVEDEKVLRDNPFPGMEPIICRLNVFFANLLLPESVPKGFEEIFAKGSEARNTLSEGDEFFVRLFRNSNILNHFNKDFEIITPLSKIIQDIISKENGSILHHRNSLSIYSTLEGQIKGQVGKMLGLDGEKQDLEQWLIVVNKLANGRNYVLYDAWLSSLPVEAIKKEKFKIFANCPDKLEDMAILNASNKNSITAENYIKYLDSCGDVTPLENVKKVTANMDMFFLKADLILADELLRKLGFDDWLDYLDKLRFPNVQNQLFQSVNNTEDFPLLMDLIVRSTNLQTAKSHLAMLLLQNYYEFVVKTFLELQRYRMEFIGPEEIYKYAVAEEAEKMSGDLLDSQLPNTFSRIIATVINDDTANDVILISILDWVSSLNKLYSNSESQLKVIDCISELFVERVTLVGCDAKWIASSLQPGQVNWQSLGILTELLDNSREDRLLRDVIFELHLDFIGDPNFFYSGVGGANSNVLFGHAYNFARLLACYDSPFQKWKEIYLRFKIRFEGWLINRHQSAVLYRETFLLAAGYCLGCVYYDNSSLEQGRQTTTTVSEMLLVQTRLQGDRGSIDFNTPITVCALTLAKHDTKHLNEILSEFVNKLDSLELLLVFCAHAEPETLSRNITVATKLSLLKRIENDFWILENRFKGKSPLLFDNLNKIREQIQGSFV